MLVDDVSSHRGMHFSIGQQVVGSVPITWSVEPTGQTIASAGHAMGLDGSHFGTSTQTPLQVWTPQVVPVESHLQAGSLGGQAQPFVVLPAAAVHAQPSQETTHVWLAPQSAFELQPVGGGGGVTESGTQTPAQSGGGTGHSAISQVHVPPGPAMQRPVGPATLPSEQGFTGRGGGKPHLVGSWQRGAPAEPPLLPGQAFASQCWPAAQSESALQRPGVGMGLQVQGPRHGSLPSQAMTSPGLQVGKVQPQGEVALESVGFPAAPPLRSQGHW